LFIYCFKHYTIKWNKICKKKYLACVSGVDGKIHAEGVVQHRRWRGLPSGWIFPSTPETHDRYLYSSTGSWCGNPCPVCKKILSFSHVIVTLQVIRQHSRSACTLNRSYGYANGQIWVNNGCRATFEVCSCDIYREMDCDSWGYRFQSCPVPGIVTYVQLKEKRSSSDCIKDQSYGSSQSSIWVDNGCRGRFHVCQAWSPNGTPRYAKVHKNDKYRRNNQIFLLTWSGHLYFFVWWTSLRC